jgi:predicted glutamine amidotransferase
MCIAILNQNHELSLETIGNSWHNNPQGGGLLFVNKKTNQLQSFKTFELRQFYKAYLELLDVAKDNTMILHFRIATQGVKSLDNLHPFINDVSGLGFVHNGIISQHCDRSSQKSDTALFNDVVVSKLTSDFVYDEDLQNRMTKYVGKWNKLIFMNDDADVTIINENQGEWVNDQWFSNDSWCTSNRYHGHIRM